VIKFIFSGFLLVSLVTACATTNYDDNLAAAEFYMVGYGHCILNAVKKYQESNASPTEISTATESNCERELNDYRNSVTLTFLKVSSDKVLARKLAIDHAQTLKFRLKKNVIRRIIEFRLKKNKSK